MADPVDPFGHSEKIRRSPQIAANNVAATTATSAGVAPVEVDDSLRFDPNLQSCTLCFRFDNADMVRCDNQECKQWFHFNCVGVVREEVESVYWACRDCRVKERKVEEKTNNPKDNESVLSSHQNKSQKSRTSSAAKRQQLVLERIEEERRLSEARDKEYLNQKYKALEQLISESDDDLGRTEDVELSTQAKKSTAEWVEGVVDQTDLTNDPIGDSGITRNVRSKLMSRFRKVMGQNENVSVVNDNPSGQQNVQEKRRQTNYSMFSRETPLNSSAVKNTTDRSTAQVHFESNNQQEPRIHHTQNTNTAEDVASNNYHLGTCSNAEGGIKISVNGGEPQSSGVIRRPSFHIPPHSTFNTNHELQSSDGVFRRPSMHTQHLSTFHQNNSTRVPTGRQNNSSRVDRIDASDEDEYVVPRMVNPMTASTHPTNSRRNDLERTIVGRVPLRPDRDQIAARQAMPKSLPTFRGSPEDWLMFYCSYENSTSACGYSNSENLGRLMDCLKGDAMEAVKAILLHPDSVPEAIDMLKMLYGRPELIIESLVDKLHKELSPKENDLDALVKFALKVRNLVATIKKLGPMDYLQNTTLVKVLVDKLPTQTRINWAYFKNSNPRANLASFSDWLYSLAEVTSQVMGRPKSNLTTKDDSPKDGQKSRSATAGHLNAQIEGVTNNDGSEGYQNKQGSNTNQPSQHSGQQSQSTKQCPICSLESCKKVQDCKKLQSLPPKERWTAVQSKRLCYSCFGKHRHYKCRSRKKCQINGCVLYHHELLHDNERQAGGNNFNPTNESTTTISRFVPTDTTNTLSGSSVGSCNSLQSNRVPAIFKIVPVVLYGKKRALIVSAYLDSGSDLSLIERGLANELELPGTPDILSVHWAFKNTDEETDTEILSVRISGDFKFAESFKIDNVYTVEKLYLPSQSITRDWLDSYPHLKGLPISTYKDAAPRILIVLHSSKLMVSQQTIEGGWTEPIACRTRLGWIIQGPDDNSHQKCENLESHYSPNHRVSLNMCESYADNQLHQLVKEFFSFENCGIRVPDKLLESKEITRSREIMERTTIKKDGRYETGLLWRYDDVCLPDSYGMAMRRLICLENKMKKDSNLSKKLCDQIEDFVGKQYIRKLLPHEIEQKNSRTWYLPIFVVFNPKKPLKVRTVWDGAAKVKDVSLNSVLLKGPDQLVPLPDVLRRFRERLYAVTGDIGEMYHRVGLIEKDRCAQRFLWRDGKSDRKPDVYQMDVLTFGAACSPSSAQFVKNKNAMQYKSQFPRAVEAIVDNTYIDDMLDCMDTQEEAIRLLKDVKFIHKEASFEFGKITSNSMEIVQAFGDGGNPQIKNLNLSPEITTERVLGMFWKASSDMFTYSLKYAKIDETVMTGERNPTKREVLRALMSIFDPLGLIANVLIYAKILLQRVWRKGTDWDEPISESLQDDWIVWIRLLPQVERLEIPRLYSPMLSPQRPKSIQMHTFVDASIEACAAVIYFRFENESGVDCALVGAKTKVAPNKPLTVPRLELQAAVLGTRSAINILQSQRFTVDKKFYWSDSQTVLSWIMSETRRYNQFVAFRVGEILDSTAEEEWNWVSTTENVADEATKSRNKPEVSLLLLLFRMVHDTRTTFFTLKATRIKFF